MVKDKDIIAIVYKKYALYLESTKLGKDAFTNNVNLMTTYSSIGRIIV